MFGSHLVTRSGYVCWPSGQHPLPLPTTFMRLALPHTLRTRIPRLHHARYTLHKRLTRSRINTATRSLGSSPRAGAVCGRGRQRSHHLAPVLTRFCVLCAVQRLCHRGGDWLILYFPGGLPHTRLRAFRTFTHTTLNMLPPLLSGAAHYAHARRVERTALAGMDYVQAATLFLCYAFCSRRCANRRTTGGVTATCSDGIWRSRCY